MSDHTFSWSIIWEKAWEKSRSSVLQAWWGTFMSESFIVDIAWMGEPRACDLESKQPLEWWYTHFTPWRSIWTGVVKVHFYLNEQMCDFKFLSKGRASLLLCLFTINFPPNFNNFILSLVEFSCYMIYKQKKLFFFILMEIRKCKIKALIGLVFGKVSSLVQRCLWRRGYGRCLWSLCNQSPGNEA